VFLTSLLKRILNMIKYSSKNKICVFVSITCLQGIGHRAVIAYVSSERIRTRCPYSQKNIPHGISKESYGVVSKKQLSDPSKGNFLPF
jgi:hypothetical protein